MAPMSIRDIPDDVYAAFKARAAANGMPAEVMVRQWIIAQSGNPMFFAFKALGPGAASATLRRHSDHVNGVSGDVQHLNQEQLRAHQNVSLLMARNGPGDRDEARRLLQAAFEQVIEV
jgi:hypothetical protein